MNYRDKKQQQQQQLGYKWLRFADEIPRVEFWSLPGVESILWLEQAGAYTICIR